MIVTLKEATQDDWELIMAWRSNPLIFNQKYTQRKPLTWDEHYIFMATRGRWWKWFIICVNDFKTTRKVGVLNFGQLENWNPEVNSYIGEVSLPSKEDIEKEAMQLGLKWLIERGYQKVHTTIPNDNEQWICLVTDLGFNKVSPARRGESTWEKYLANEDKSTEYVTGRRAL